MNEQLCARIVQNRYQKLYSNQSDIFDNVETYHQMYRAFMTESDDYPWDYQLVDPVVFSLLRNLMARLNPEGMKVRLEARTSKSAAVRDANQAALNWELGEMQKTLVFYRFLFRGLLAGRAYMTSGWLFEPAVQIAYGKDQQKFLRDIVNRATAKNVRFQDIFVPNHNIPELDEQPYLIERVTMRYGEMLDDNETQDREVWKKKYLDEILKKRIFTTKMDYGIDLPGDDEETAKSKGKKNESDEKKWARSQYVALLKMQSKEGDIYYVPEQENEWILNKDEGNPYWHGHYPYLTWTPFPEDDDFFSMGIVQPVADLQIMASSTANQLLTSGRMAANPMTVVGKEGANLPDWVFVNRPNGVIRIPGDADQIKQLQVDQRSVSTMMQLRQEIQTVIERTTGISSLYSAGVGAGSSPQVNKTATGARVIDANLDLNMQLIVSIFGAQALQRLGDHFLELNAQYITEEQEFKLTGEESFRTIKPEENTANFDVVATPDTIMKVSPIVKQANLMNMIATLENLKTVKADVRPLVNKLVDTEPDLDDVDNVIIDPEQQALEAIDSIMQGIVPPVKPEMDHETIIMIVQKHMIDLGDQLDDETLAAFAAYLDEHRKWIEARKAILTMQPPPQLPEQVGAPLIEPEILPTDEQALLDSMSPLENPTQSLPNQIPLDELQGGGLV